MGKSVCVCVCVAGLSPATMQLMLWSRGTRSRLCWSMFYKPQIQGSVHRHIHTTLQVTGPTTCLPPNSLPPFAHDCNRYGSLSVGAVLGACAVLLVCGYLVCALLGGHLLGGSVIRGLRQCTLLVSSYMV